MVNRQVFVRVGFFLPSTLSSHRFKDEICKNGKFLSFSISLLKFYEDLRDEAFAIPVPDMPSVKETVDLKLTTSIKSNDKPAFL